MGLPEWYLGTINVKYIAIEQPFNLGSHYRSYKDTDSIILLAMIGPRYEFLYIDVGVCGHKSDGGGWSKCALKNTLEQNTLNVPTPIVLPGRNVPVQYVCITNNTFPLSTNMMKLYP